MCFVRPIRQTTADFQGKRAITAKKIIGTSRLGSKLRVLQSLIFIRLKPEAMMSMPPTIESSAMSESLIADCDRRAIR